MVLAFGPRDVEEQGGMVAERDQFVGHFEHGRLRAPAPEEMLVRRPGPAAGDERREVHAVERGVGSEARRGNGGRRDVEVDHGLVVGGARRPGAGPGTDEGRADAPLGQHAFLAGERGVERAVPGLAERRAVVAGKHDQRVLLRTHLPEFRADPAESVVHRGHHRERLPAGERQRFRRLAEPRLGRFERHVRRIPGEVEKPGLAGSLGTPIEKRNRRVRLHHHAKALVHDAVRRVGEGPALEVVRGFIPPQFAAEVFGEALVVRHVVGQQVIAFPLPLLPADVEVAFADPAARVAGGSEQFGDRALGEGEWAVVVVLDAKPLLVAARDQPGPRGHALRGRDVAPWKPHAVASQLVEMRRADVGVGALDGKVGPAVVVGIDDENIRRRRGGGRRLRRQGGDGTDDFGDHGAGKPSVMYQR